MCNDGTLYTGITTDLTRRLAEHNHSGATTRKSGRGAAYTRSRQPVALVYSETQPDRSGASRREWQVKKMSRNAKLALVNSWRAIDSINPDN